MKRDLLTFAAAALFGMMLFTNFACDGGDDTAQLPVVRLWATTSVANGNTFTQRDRLARPAPPRARGARPCRSSTT